VIHHPAGSRRDDVIAKLKETEPVLRSFGVAALYLFGSHARDEASPDSDVDVFVDVAPGAAFGLRPYMGAFRVLEDAFEHKAEIGYSTRDEQPRGSDILRFSRWHADCRARDDQENIKIRRKSWRWHDRERPPL
jgi:predicted nucleotidyltransferase